MANHNPSGRNNDDNRASWRPQDQDRNKQPDAQGSDTDWQGQGQSGYGSGRMESDRSFSQGNRNQTYGGRQGSQGNQDDRWSGRGGSSTAGTPDEDRGYNPERYGAQGGYGGGSGFEDRFGGGAQSAGRGAQQYNQGRGAPAYDAGFADRSGFDRGGFDRGGNGGPSMRGHDADNSWDNAYARTEQPRSQGADQSMYGQGSRGSWQSGQGPQRGGSSGPSTFDRDRQERMSQSGMGQRGAQSRPGMGQGMHRGKGPAGYQRSDERIKEAVSEALEHDEHIDATHIEVVVKNGEVMLTGTVDDRQQKRLAEECVEHLAGVKDVQNSLRVQGENRQAQRTQTQGASGSAGSNGNGASAMGKPETDGTGPSGSGTGGDRKARA